MRPVNNSTFIIPFVLAIKADKIVLLQRKDSWRHINIVSNQERLA